jgi:hypothetical protein
MTSPHDIERRLNDLEQTAGVDDLLDEVVITVDTTADGDPVTIDGEILNASDTVTVADFTDEGEY